MERVCPALKLFDRIVSENGAVVYDPQTREERPLVPPPPPAFIDELRHRIAEPLYLGRVIVATRDDYDEVVRRLIADQGLDLQIILNKGALMILPFGVDKAFGLRAVLAEIKCTPQETVGLGDAENDVVLLACCGCRVAVANALPLLKAHADWVTTAAAGTGAIELIDRWLRDDLAAVVQR